MQGNSNSIETADIFYFIPFRKDDSVLLIAVRPERYTKALSRYVRKAEILDETEIAHLCSMVKVGLFDKVLVFLGKGQMSNSLIYKVSNALKSEGNFIFTFENKDNWVTLAKLFKKGVLKELASYGLFDSSDRPSSIIPMQEALMSYYFRNIRFPTIRWFKKLLLQVLILFRVHSLAIPGFLVVCKKV